MRSAGLLTTLLLAQTLAAAAGAADIPRRAWSGAGRTDKASEDENWIEGKRPQGGERVVFGGTSPKDCRWDLDVTLSSFTLTHDYKGRVMMGTSDVKVLYNVRVAGGALDLENATLTVNRRVYVDWGGTLELSRGHLRLGDQGILVDNGGKLKSTSAEKPARLSAAQQVHFPFVVGAGEVTLANPAGTVVERSKGIVLYSKAEVAQAANVVVTEVEQGAAAVTVGTNKAQPVKLENWTFDESQVTKVAAAAPEQTSGKSLPAPVVLTEAPKPSDAPGAPLVLGPERVWTGSGASALASDAANWRDGVPGPGTVAVFSGPSTKSVEWDLPTSLDALRLDPGFGGEVLLGTSSLRLRQDLTAAGGRLDLGSSDVRIGRDFVVAAGGAVELGQATVRVGRALRLEGGRLSSTAEEAAILTAADPESFFSMTLASGAIEFTNAAGTRVDASSGIVVGPRTSLLAFDRVLVTHLAPGAAALTIERDAASVLVLTGWSFDESVGVSIDASGLPAGAQLALAAASGPGAGSPRHRDPNGTVVWEPDQTAPASDRGEPLAELQRRQAVWTPFVSVELMGGQYFFEEADGALSGNGRVLAAVSVQHPRWPGWTLQPLLSSQYRGTKQVADLVGGGTLFQETMEHRLAVRAVFEASEKWRLKPEVSYKAEYLKETRDEEWGKGLFDQSRPMASVEAEYVYRDPFSVRFGYDYFLLRFPRYVSLESQARSQQGSALSRELSGGRVIDSDNHSLRAAGTAELPWRSLLEAGIAYSMRSFPEQHLVDARGDLSPGTRDDATLAADIDWRFPRQASARWKVLAGLGAGFARTDSNQSSYDAQRVRYLPDFYDSESVRLGGELTAVRALARDRALTLGLSGSLVRTRYPDRPVQDAAGTFGSATIRKDTLYLSAQARYPIARRFHWTLAAQYAKQDSNMKYEKLYRYNFGTFAYLMGFSWQY